MTEPSGPWPVVAYLAVVAAAATALVVLSIRKGPPARWQWGDRSED